MKKIIALVLLCSCGQATFQGNVDKTLNTIDLALAVMECNAAVLRSTNQAIIDLCPVPKDRLTCPAMVQILADLAVGLEQCKEGL